MTDLEKVKTLLRGRRFEFDMFERRPFYAYTETIIRVKPGSNRFVSDVEGLVIDFEFVDGELFKISAWVPPNNPNDVK